jgi:hypothetical protein
MSPGVDAPHNAHILEKYCLNNPSGEILCLYFAHAQKYILILGRHLSKIIFTRGISKSSPVLRQVGRATGKNPVLKSSSEGNSISWLDDVRLHC